MRYGALRNSDPMHDHFVPEAGSDRWIWPCQKRFWNPNQTCSRTRTGLYKKKRTPMPQMGSSRTLWLLAASVYLTAKWTNLPSGSQSLFFTTVGLPGCFRGSRFDPDLTQQKTPKNNSSRELVFWNRFFVKNRFFMLNLWRRKSHSVIIQ